MRALLLASLLISCASQDAKLCRANAGANHLMRLRVKCVEAGFPVDDCPHVERIDAQLDQEWAACQ